MKRSELIAFLAEENPSGASVIICPGGSYCYLGIRNEGFKVAEWFQKKGISAFVLRYRIGVKKNRHPAMIQDLQRAIQLVKENQVAYGIDSSRVGVVGFSAGGHLAGTAATYYHINFMEELDVKPDVSLRPGFVALIYPVVSMTDSIGHKKSRRNLLGKNYTPELKKMMSLEQNTHPHMPPVFMIHCTKDQTVDYRNALYYKEALEKTGVEHNFTLYDEKGHGFGIDPESARAPSWINQFIPWLRDIRMID
jgi:acetyl esterase/lipase